MAVAWVAVLMCLMAAADSCVGRHYFVHNHSIGPAQQQAEKNQWFHCSSASTCREEAGKYCDTAVLVGGKPCLSYALSPRFDGGASAELYTTDYNGSMWAAAWVMYSKSDGPPHPPGPPPPPPPPPSQANRTDYCLAKRLVLDKSRQLLDGDPFWQSSGQRVLDLVASALQLSLCSNASGTEQRFSQSHHQPTTRPGTTAGRPPAAASLRAAPSPGVVVYVHPSGSDAGQGLDPQTPVTSLHRAFEVVRDQRRAGVLGLHDLARVEVLPGHHFLDQTLSLTAEDSHVVVAGHGRDQTIVHGAQSFAPEWKHFRDNIYVADIPPSVSLSNFSSLFGPDGRRLSRSRFPEYPSLSE